MQAISTSKTLMPAARTTAAPSPEPEAPVTLRGSSCPDLSSCQRLRAANPNDPVTVSVILKHPKPLRLPANRQPMTPQQLAQYHATPEQIGSVEQFAKANGLSVASSDPATRTVKLTGTTAQLGKAFGVNMNQYKDAGGNTFRAYEGGVKLPKNVAANVEGVFGLENRPIATPKNTGFQPRAAGGNSPVTIANLYNFPKGTDGTGQTIGIIELGGGYKDDDIKNYFAKLGIPAPQVTSVSVDGGANTPTGNANSADGEVALDIDVAGAVAPGAKIVVYFAGNTAQGFQDAVNQAAHDTDNHPNVLSVSWGGPENRFPASGKTSFNNILKDAAAAGVNVYCASGDGGSVDGDPLQRNTTDFPASSPWAVGAGGTQLNFADGKITSETTWNDLANKGGSGGGGVSASFPKPDYQSGVDVPKPGGLSSKGGRGVPDVAGDAAPSTGYDVLVDGTEGQFGGTSAVAPLYAALTARLGQGLGAPVGFLNPFFYQHPEAFNDITQGTNGGFSAGPGWDAVTGMGSPDGEKLLAALKAQQHA